MAVSETGEDVTLSTASDGATAGGAVVESLYCKREMKIYPMTESELQAINVFNTVTAGALSAAAFMAGIYFNVWWDVNTAGGKAVHTMGDPMLTLLKWLIAGCLVVAGIAYWKKGGLLTRITRESRVLGRPDSAKPTDRRNWFSWWPAR